MGTRPLNREVEKDDTRYIEEENVLKFYYVESLDDYWIGRRLETKYFAEYDEAMRGFVWRASRHLPWGKHIVDPSTAWKEYTYPSEPKEIPFMDWLEGFFRKHFTAIPEDWIEAYAKKLQEDNRPIMADEIRKMVVEWKVGKENG